MLPIADWIAMIGCNVYWTDWTYWTYCNSSHLTCPHTRPCGCTFGISEYISLHLCTGTQTTKTGSQITGCKLLNTYNTSIFFSDLPQNREIEKKSDLPRRKHPFCRSFLHRFCLCNRSIHHKLFPLESTSFPRTLPSSMVCIRDLLHDVGGNLIRGSKMLDSNM